jgi:hypothetical protein
VTVQVRKVEIIQSKSGEKRTDGTRVWAKNPEKASRMTSPETK